MHTKLEKSDMQKNKKTLHNITQEKKSLKYNLPNFVRIPLCGNIAFCQEFNFMLQLYILIIKLCSP